MRVLVPLLEFNLHVLLALAALVVGFTVPALAQQKEPPLSEQDYQKLLAMGKKNCQTQSYLRIGQRYLRMTQNPL
jgi:hypothetical protein